ncbi:MAG: CDP-diacylglycerol--glycerol-3-phosphate 3-phosphatidyltransferase [Peptoniphilaceae bacterium]|nr:CDP-diacylglycerol--glycerol-3-phosphate 3-phosphatidyltransferase [Peptoniphilaceae bacterium]MDY6085534.1 CDP-diacylglycerol--glycerol-3-phosphate 3-phosphatidyltransferase [Peptoniphilaceae bacterium]
MNLANKITMVRLASIPVFVAAYLFLPEENPLAGIIFVLASMTDFIDGHIARSRNMVTTFGKFADPLVDKILTISAFVLLAESHRLAGWIVVIIVARELIITGFRTVAASQGTTIAASKWGKFKTTFQMVAVAEMLFEENLFPFLLGTPARQVLVLLALFFTILSGVDYIVKNKEVLDPQNM